MDTAGHILLEANHLYARNTTSSSSSTSDTRPTYYKIVGIILAVCSGLFIGVSFVVKKVGLLKANEKYNEVAGEGYGYLKNAWWWAGMTTMIVGEICNFVAYAFVDAILVTPFGALSVVITTILSAIFLKERLSFVGKVGCFNCVIGAVVIAINAPTESSASNIQEMQKFVIAPGFLSYAGVIIVGAAFTALWVGPRYGKKSMFVYITICSVIGGLSVVATQGLGAAIVAQISGTNTHQFEQWFLYVLLVFVIATLLTEIIYLNKALNLFNAALVTPTYYVMFTSATIVTSAILFRGFSGTWESITTVIMGFLFICSGVVLLQLAKSSKDVPDTAVFQGDLDQVRTIAEQEEPESEPRADTIRGGAAIVRAISKKRTERQLDELKTIHADHMAPITEDEHFYYDGLRRRKTVLAPGQQSIRRQKTVHPPLGMSQFPDDTHSEAGSLDSEAHPGFHFPKFMGGRKSSAATQARSATSLSHHGTVTELKDLEQGRNDSASKSDNNKRNPSPHVFGLPAGLQPTHHDGTSDFEQDTSYRSAHIDLAPTPPRPSPRTSSLYPPPPPPLHQSTTDAQGPAKRTFSFQNPVSRLFRHGHGASHAAIPLSDDDDDSAVFSDTHFSFHDDDTRPPSAASQQRRPPTSRSAFSYQSRRGSFSRPLTAASAVSSLRHGRAGSGETEEERLGLVKAGADNEGARGVLREEDEYVQDEDYVQDEEYMRPHEGYMPRAQDHVHRNEAYLQDAHQARNDGHRTRGSAEDEGLHSHTTTDHDDDDGWGLVSGDRRDLSTSPEDLADLARFPMRDDVFGADSTGYGGSGFGGMAASTAYGGAANTGFATNTAYTGAANTGFRTNTAYGGAGSASFGTNTAYRAPANAVLRGTEHPGGNTRPHTQPIYGHHEQESSEDEEDVEGLSFVRKPRGPTI